MTTITIKNLPPELYERLKQKAKDNRRSINNEAIIMLEMGLQIVPKRTPAEVEKILEDIRKLRESMATYKLTDEDIDKAINEGRP